jgi:hypothetical protein
MLSLRKIGWTIFTHAAVAALAVAMFYLYLSIPDAPSSCVESAHIISQSRLGDKIEMNQEICGGIAFSATISLNLIENREGRQGTFFSYQWTNSQPTITWVADDAVLITIENVGPIHSKLEKLGRVKIQYKIGNVSS